MWRQLLVRRANFSVQVQLIRRDVLFKHTLAPSTSESIEKNFELKNNDALKRMRKQASVYLQLSKARLSSLVVLSGAAGFLLAGAPVAVDTLLAFSVGTYLTAFSANSLNQLYERNTDKLMKRTRMRPLPSGRITPVHALGYGVGTGVLGVGMLAMTCNPLTAALGAANIMLYAMVYTPMKRSSIYNTWIGSVVGAIPPLMGYAAATGSVLSCDAALLSAGLFFWQFPHFFALAWLNKKDYSVGGHQMAPCFDDSGCHTASLLVRYSVYLSTLPPAAYACGITSSMFPLESIAFNGYLLWACHKFEEESSRQNARRIFLCSLWYLPVFMALMIFHKKDWAGADNDITNVITVNGIKYIERNDAISRAICKAKRLMKQMCLHELVAANSNEDLNSLKRKESCRFCPASAFEK